jgi:hypothetical protein
MDQLTQAVAERFAAATLSHLGRQYPYKMDLVLNGPEDARPPIEHHPIFHGSFDWHSCVHGWWQVLRLARQFPAMAHSHAIIARADAMLTPANVAGERAFLVRPNAGGFERPYGWAWALALHGEAALHDAPWAKALEPLARDFAARFTAFLPKMTYPIRVGTHYNSAFALTLAHGWARAYDPALMRLIEERARHWFTQDRHAQAWEPGGDEFLSSTLCEAMLMSHVLARNEFADWFSGFLPDVDCAQPATLFEPAHVSDRSDGKIAHLDGLNLSRAWCWRRIGAQLAPTPLAPLIDATIARHLDASLPHVTGDYMGEHWLATFALLALEPAREP